MSKSEKPGKAKIKPAQGPQPKAENTTGRVTPKTQPSPIKKAPTNPHDKGYAQELQDWAENVKSPEHVKDQWAQLQQAKDAAQAAGDRLGVTAAKDGLAVLQDKASQLGMSGRDLPGVETQLLDILGALSGGGGRGRRGAVKGAKPTAAAPTPAQTPTAPTVPPAPATPSKQSKPSKGGYTPGKGRNANGTCGESIAKSDLEKDGYEVTSVQNKSGHGIDLERVIDSPAATGRWRRSRVLGKVCINRRRLCLPEG